MAFLFRCSPGGNVSFPSSTGRARYLLMQTPTVDDGQPAYSPWAGKKGHAGVVVDGKEIDLREGLTAIGAHRGCAIQTGSSSAPVQALLECRGNQVYLQTVPHTTTAKVGGMTFTWHGGGVALRDAELLSTPNGTPLARVTKQRKLLPRSTMMEQGVPHTPPKGKGVLMRCDWCQFAGPLSLVIDHERSCACNPRADPELVVAAAAAALQRTSHMLNAKVKYPLLLTDSGVGGYLDNGSFKAMLTAAPSTVPGDVDDVGDMLMFHAANITKLDDVALLIFGNDTKTEYGVAADGRRRSVTTAAHSVTKMTMLVKDTLKHLPNWTFKNLWALLDTHAT